MKITNLFFCTSLLLASIFSCNEEKTTQNLITTSEFSEYDNQKEGFQNPPQAARPKVYWWWLNGNLDTLRMQKELKEIKDAGLGGVDIFDIGVPETYNPGNMIPAGPGFMSDKALGAMKVALNEAAKLELDVGLSLSSSWNAGGSWVEPQFAAKTVYYSKVSVNNHQEQKIKLPFPEITPGKDGKPRQIEYSAEGKPTYYEEVSVIAFPSSVKNKIDTTQIINVSQFFNPENEILNWKVPNGEWEIYRFISSNSGERLARPSGNSDGPILDHFDSTATKMHLMYFIDKLRPLVGELSKSSLKYFYLASYEAKEFAWTSSFPAEFKRLNGYDVHKFLPSIFEPEIFDREILERFNHDYAETFSELMINNHYRKAKEICNNHGLQIISEAGGPGHMHHIPVETLKALGSLDIPRGEFWYERPYYDKDSVDMVWLVKEIAAASHIYKKDIVEQEAFTSYWDWQESPYDLKNFADRAFAEGMNKLVIHGFSHNPSEYGSPGIVYWAGTHYNDKRVWWPKVKPFNEYLGRVSHILQNTDFVADVLYYYGEEIPNLIPPKNTRFSVGAGYDYEVINTEVLINDLIVENGELVLPGISRYRLLYVDEEEMSLPTLKKIKELTDQGAIIVGGEKPKRVIGLTTDPEADKAIKELADDLWMSSSESNLNKKGKIHSDRTLLEVLRTLGVSPDFDYSDNHPDQREAPLDYIHYKAENLDFYFIRNTTDRWISRTCSFRQQNKKPEVWNPTSGEIAPISIFDQKGEQVEIPISLAPHGSFFVVFKNEIPSSHYTKILPIDQHPPQLEYTKNGVILIEKGTFEFQDGSESQKINNEPVIKELSGEWNLTFPENWGAPSTTVFPELISWTEAEDKGIRYFSGIAEYSKTFEFNKNRDDGLIYLDLGNLAEVAEVWLNEKSLGITWTKPHRFEISDIVREGKNTIRVEVANTWSNRLTGDAIFKENYTQTNVVKANKNTTPWESLPLKKSGLLGPVTVQILKPVEFN